MSNIWDNTISCNKFGSIAIDLPHFRSVHPFLLSVHLHHRIIYEMFSKNSQVLCIYVNVKWLRYILYVSFTGWCNQNIADIVDILTMRYCYQAQNSIVVIIYEYLESYLILD